MSPDEVCKLVSSYNLIFEGNHTKITPEEEYKDGPDGSRHLHLYIPYKTSKFDKTGIKLKDGMGSVSIEIIYEVGRRGILKEIGHSYRYFNLEHSYEFSYADASDSSRKSQDRDTYHFRYDRDLKPVSEEPKEHIQVLHNVPRFPTNRGELKDFLAVVESSCFKGSSPLREPFWANRR